MLLSRVLKAVAALYLVALIVSVMAYKAAFLGLMFHNVLFGVYSVCVAGYILSRFLFSLFYRSSPDAGLEPRIAIVMPGYNEEDAIAQSLTSLLKLDYPVEKLQLIAVNDGSSDGTLAEMRRVADSAPGRVKVIDFPENRGKRAAMAAGIRDSDAETIVFVDSDSVVAPDALRKLVQPFADPRVGAVCGHADVLNLRDNWLTRMQGVRYFVAFRVVKAAESVFHCVTCCSGCFSAYRREAILARMEWWENQTFLGVYSTFGDDRSLTNCVLRDWRVVYEKRAVSHTIVPDTFRGFLKQQTRWKRSWTRESLLVAKFIWRKHPVAALLHLPLDRAAADRADRRAARARLGPADPRRHAAARLPRRDLLARDGLLALLRALPGRVQPRLALRRAVRLLLPRDHAVADLLRDRDLPHVQMGHARARRRRSPAAR